MNPGGVDTSHNLLRAAAMLYEGDVIDARKLRERFNVSKATAKRYMVRLELSLPVSVSGVGRTERRKLKIEKPRRTGT